jgi:type I restriction enzyme S subunit
MSIKTQTATTKAEAKHALVPKLRFPQFRGADAWEASTLGAKSSILKGKGISKADLDPNGSQACIRYGELYTRYGETIREVVSRTNVPAAELLLSRPDDVIIPSSGETKIDIAKASCVFAGGIALGGDLNVIRSKLNGTFLSYYLNGPKRLDIAKVAQGDTVVHLYPHQLEALQIAVPQSYEQQKIAECLSSVDELMAAQARKVDALKTHKKGLMQQLFPREGETQPRLRFPEFRNAPAWEVKPLGTVAENLDNQRVPITSSDRKVGPVPYYGASGIVDYVEGFIFDEDLLCVSEDGANLVARTYPIAFPISGRTWVNNHAHVLRFESAYTQKFVEVYLNSIKLDDFITGMAQPKLNRAMLDRIPIPHTGVLEQQRIASCLSTLDDLITAETQKLDALKTHKKGLMQQLFPSPEAVEV